jgi:UDP-N-acetyl-D-glucosamine dehydrogenase
MDGMVGMDGPAVAEPAVALKEKLDRRTAVLGIIGMGYVGLPLAVAAHRAGFSVIGFDIDVHRVDIINRGEAPIRSIAADSIAKMRETGRFHATVDFEELRSVDVAMICVPTPLTRYRDPDVSFIEKTGKSIAPRLRRGHLVVLESSSYPGTTTEVLQPLLEEGGLKLGTDFFLAYAPEREDPGNRDFETATIPRVVGGDDKGSAMLAETLYAAISGKVVPVSSCATAEAVKLTENIFRAVNIALVNELKLIYRKMGIDVWEVIDAAKTKPFGFMPFYPGPGIGGHCIPIDPFYLTWKAREFDVATRFIELAGEVNVDAPRHVVTSLIEALSKKRQRSLSGARILLLGVAYKKNIDDMRESPSLKLFELLQEQGAIVEYYDPFFPEMPPTRQHAQLAGRKSVAWRQDVIESFDAVLIGTDHDDVDYGSLVNWSKLVVDTRNVTKNIATGRDKIVLA